MYAAFIVAIARSQLKLGRCRGTSEEEAVGYDALSDARSRTYTVTLEH